MTKKPPTEPEIVVFVCGRKCDHVFDGPVVDLDGRGEAVTCSKCGLDAMSVSLMEGL